MLWTFIKLTFVIEIFVLSILSGRFTQVLLYSIFCYHETSIFFYFLMLQASHFIKSYVLDA